MDTVRQKLESIQEDPSLNDEDTRAAITQLYNRSLELLQTANRHDQQAQRFSDLRQAAPSHLNNLRQELSQPPPEPKLDLPEEPTIPEIEQRLNQAEADLNHARKRATELQQEPQIRATRRVQIANAMAQAKARLAEMTQGNRTVIPPDQDIRLTRAKRILQLAEQQAIESEIKALEQEMLSFEARAELLTARQDQAARRVAYLKQLASLLQSRLNELREQESERALAQAEQQKTEAIQAAYNHEIVSGLASRNTELVNLRAGPDGLTASIAKATETLNNIKRRLTKLTSDFTGVKQRVDVFKDVGITGNNVIGVVLRRQRENLPDIGYHRNQIQQRRQEMSNTQLQIINFSDERSELLDIEAKVENVAKRLDPALSDWQRETILTEVNKLYQARREYLADLIRDLEAYFRTLTKLDAQEKTLIRETKAFSEYIHERVFWIQSTDRLSFEDVIEEAKTINSVFINRGWLQLGTYLKGYLLKNPLQITVFTLVLLGFYHVRRGLREELERLGVQATKSLNTSFFITIQALIDTTLIALFWPLVIWLIGWILSYEPSESPFIRNLSQSLQTIAPLFLTMEFYRQVCRRGGLAECHFTWNPFNAKLMARQLQWLILIGLPIAFVIAFVESQDSEKLQGRIAFMLSMGALALFAHCVLHPKRGLRPSLPRQREAFQSVSLGKTAYLIGVGLPIALAIAAGAGFYFTALQLAWRLLSTLWLLLGILILNAFILRWLFIARRRLAIEQSRKKRETQPTPNIPDSLPKDEVGTGSSEYDTVDLSLVNLQTKRLLKNFTGLILLLGIWSIWVDVLPALNVLEEMKAWNLPASKQQTVTMPEIPGRSGSSQSASGLTGLSASAESPSGSSATAATGATVAGSARGTGGEHFVSYADLLLALLITLMTIAAARNLPGLLEITVIPRMNLRQGGGYAITTVVRYMITLVGLVIAFGMIGITWSKVQWLAAAIMLGIGFGLQEIVANFVSGLIILYERPVRLGDVVTVGDLTGSVSKIEIRATTITNWDNQEYIIPNKEFITNKLTNWTLTDPVNRLVFTVGVSYKSDTKLAYQLLLKVAHENPLVLKEPPPSAVFYEFGENALIFHLRLYIATVDYLIPVRHQINSAIHQTLANAGIEIAYPQRDLNIRSYPPDTDRSTPKELTPSHQPDLGQATS